MLLDLLGFQEFSIIEVVIGVIWVIMVIGIIKVINNLDNPKFYTTLIARITLVIQMTPP